MKTLPSLIGRVRTSWNWNRAVVTLNSKEKRSIGVADWWKFGAKPGLVSEGEQGEQVDIAKRSEKRV